MKKMTFRLKQWLRRRARNQFRRSKRHSIELPVRVWIDGDVEYAISAKAPTYPPEIMCLDTNELEVTQFLEHTRRRMLQGAGRASWHMGKGRQRKRIRGFLDCSKIREISTSAALVFAAEYERLVAIIGSPPPLVNLHEWNENVFKRLFELGFFQSIGVTPDQPELLLSADQDIMTLRFLSGSNAKDTKKAGEMLVELGNFLDSTQSLPEDIKVPLTSALSEAMINVKQHAYPSDYRFAYRHVQRWWLTGSANRKTRTLTIVIYDQGATIPVTYARVKKLASIRSWIESNFNKEASHPFDNDGVNLAAAVRFGNSQTDEPHRGKGLPDMKFAIDQCKNGKLTILSRGGRYVYNGLTQTSEHSSYPASIGGTLIEWSLTLPSV